METMISTANDLHACMNSLTVQLTTYFLSPKRKRTSAGGVCVSPRVFLELRNELSTFVLVGNVVRFVRIDEIPGTYSRVPVCPAGVGYNYDVRRMDS